MNTQPLIRGVLSPVLTPFDAELAPDSKRFIAHCRWLLGNHVGLAIFGTNSEANSLSVAEKLRLMDEVLAAGIPAARLMPGTGACSISDAVELSRHASRHGAAGLLMLPPFYYKGVSDDGLFAYFAEVIERVGEGCAPIYLYNIPPVSQVPISMALIERLLARYPGVVAGVKDSSGDWNNTKTMLDMFGKQGFDVFAGSETFLSDNMRHGGAGCISATANVNPAALHELYEKWDSPQGPDLQARADAVRKIFQGPAMIAAMKHAVARFSKDEQWDAVRPPLVALDAAGAAKLEAAMDAAGFAIEGYPQP